MVTIPKLSDELEKDIIYSILEVTSRLVTITTVSARSVCPVCFGNDPFCPTCNGNGTVDSQIITQVPARVKWAGSDRKLYTHTGQYPEGDCTITMPAVPSGYIAISGVTVSGLYPEDIANVTVDNRICVVDKWYFRGDPINRIYLVLNQDTNSRQRIG